VSFAKALTTQRGTGRLRKIRKGEPARSSGQKELDAVLHFEGGDDRESSGSKRRRRRRKRGYAVSRALEKASTIGE